MLDYYTCGVIVTIIPRKTEESTYYETAEIQDDEGWPLAVVPLDWLISHFRSNEDSKIYNALYVDGRRIEATLQMRMPQNG